MTAASLNTQIMLNTQVSLKTEDRLRRSRYARDPAAAPRALTPLMVQALQTVGDFRFASLPQLVRLHGDPARSGGSSKAVQRAMRALLDAGLVDVIPVPRAILAAPGEANDATLLFGSAPNLYAPTKAGLKLLCENGMTGEGGIAGGTRPGAAYGPKNALFLRHEMEVRDVRVWAVIAAAARPRTGLLEWRDGAEAAISLGAERAPRHVRPDARFVLRLGRADSREAVLVGLVEVDRGTERGERRWGEKIEAYGSLLEGDRLRDATGYVNARVLVICPDARRADPALAARFWLAGRDALARPDLGRSDWRRADSPLMRPLVPPDLQG